MDVKGKPELVPLYKIPYMLFGTTSSRSYLIYAFFPAIYNPSNKKKSVYVSDKRYRAFYEKLLLPSLRKLSYRVALAND